MRLVRPLRFVGKTGIDVRTQTQYGQGVSEMIEEILTTNIEPNPWQPRTRFDKHEIAELARSIEEDGLIEYPVGRRHPDGNGHIQLAVGECRWLAFQQIGAMTMPVDIRELTDDQMSKYGLIENTKRVDLSPIEIATGIQRRIEDFGYTHMQVGEELGKSREWVSNTLRLLNLPEEIKGQVHEREISARAADALLSITDLPESLQESAEEDHWEKFRPSQILEDVKAGKVTSDEIRERSKGIVERNTKDLDDAIFPLDFTFEETEAIVSPLCNTCDSRMDVKKVQHCAIPACWETKTETWKRIALENASTDSGIPILELAEDETKYSHCNTFWSEELTQGEEGIFAAGCENLRLVYDQNPYVAEMLDAEKHPNIAITCYHGKSKSCKCEKAKRADLNRDEREAQQARKKVLKSEILAPAAAALAESIADGQPAAWLILYRKLVGTSGGDKWSLEQLQNRIALKLVEKSFTLWDPENDLERSRNDVVKNILTPIGREDVIVIVKSPIEELQEQFERIQCWISLLDLEYPTPDAVKGNIVNLETLIWEMEKLPGDQQDEALAADIDFELARLKALLLVVETELAEPLDMDTVCGLANLELIDDGLEELVSEAGLEEIKYALALVTGDEERMEVLQKALEQE